MRIMTAPHPLLRAIEIAGSEAKLAERVGCSQAAINKAKKAGSVSAEMAVKLERTVGIRRSEWRPDLWSEAPANDADAALLKA